jgi:hypothetical protein
MDARIRKYKLMSKGMLEDRRRKDRETIRTARRQMDQFDRWQMDQFDRKQMDQFDRRQMDQFDRRLMDQFDQRQMDQFDRRQMDQFDQEINRSKVIFAALVGLISGFLILQIVGIV